MPGIGIVLNPHSKKHKLDPDRMQNLAFIVGDKGSCKETTDLEDLRRVAEEFKTRDVEILAIGGGDGTNHVTLTNFIRVYGEKPLPKITFLRGGTLNTLATACKIRGTPEKILSNLIYKYHEDLPFEVKEMDLMNINGSYGFIFGTGVLYKFMRKYYEKTPSPARSLLVLGQTVGSALINGSLGRHLFERYEAEVEVDGEKWPFKNYSALYAGSVDRLGMNFRVFHYAEVQGKFHAVGFSLPPRNIIKHVPGMYFGKPAKSENIIEKPATSMIMRFKEAQPYFIDGDMCGSALEIKITIGPRLKIIVS